VAMAMAMAMDAGDAGSERLKDLKAVLTHE
jgi:hypothetical protein